MRILRYLINTSLALSLSVSGLRANENKGVSHLLDAPSYRLVESARPSDDRALGLGVHGSTVYPRKIIQADQSPIEKYEYSRQPGLVCAVTMTNFVGHLAVSGVYSELSAALEAASTSRSNQIMMQCYYQHITKIRAYPAGTQFSIAPELMEKLTYVDTHDVADLKEGLDAIGGRVVTSVPWVI